MAGIGFRLREMSNRKTFAEWLKLYTYSAIIFSGPWLISILALSALSIFAIPSLQMSDVRLFTVTIVYIYCFSLIVTGAIQLVITRYVSDQFYIRNPEAVVPTFVGAISVTAIFQTITGAAALFFTDFDLVYKILILGLYVSVSIIWVEMVFLSAAKDYTNIVLSFAVGYLLSFVAGQVLGMFLEIDGMAVGFLAGQVLLMVLLMYRIMSEYRFGKGFDFRFLGHIRKYPALMIVGIAYNAAIWIDKIIMWYSTSGIEVHGYFYTHFPYDSALFIAYLTIIPTLAIFLLRIETDFYLKYKNYYGTVIQKAPLRLIVKRKREMIDVLTSALKTVLIYQGIVTTGVFILLPFLVSLLTIDPVFTPIFRVAVIGAFFHGLLMVLMILMLYFDFRGSAMLVSLFFLFSNAGFTYLSLGIGNWAHGFGYLVSCMLSLILGMIVFYNRVKNLEYLTFMRQPLL